MRWGLLPTTVREIQDEEGMGGYFVFRGFVFGWARGGVDVWQVAWETVEWLYSRWWHLGGCYESIRATLCWCSGVCSEGIRQELGGGSMGGVLRLVEGCSFRV